MTRATAPTVAEIQQILRSGVPLAGAWGVEVLRAEGGGALVRLPFREDLLRPGDTVIEYTGGSTGTSLALICAAKGYRLHVVTSTAFSQEKLDHITQCSI